MHSAGNASDRGNNFASNNIKDFGFIMPTRPQT